MNARQVAVVPMLVGLMMLVGCPGPTKVAVYPVTGKVTVEGKPLTGCNIVFFPVGKGLSASGVIGADGTYKLATDGGREGVVPGIYKVQLAPGQEMAQKMMVEQMADQMKSAQPGGGMGQPTAPKLKTPYPESYGAADTSPKEVTVEAKSQVINIDI